MVENLPHSLESFTFHRPRWITTLCLILWGLAHVFGAIAIVFLNAAFYDKGDPAAQEQSSPANLPPDTPMTVSISDAAPHRCLDWGIAAGVITLLLIIAGVGLWRMKLWSIVPLGMLVLASLPAILSAVGLDIHLIQ